MAMDEKGLGQRLSEARRAAGKTQQALCHETGLSYSTLAKIERGAIKAPSVFTIQNIAICLGTTLDELLGTVTSPHANRRPAAQIPEKKISKSGIRFVFFDVNGCLVRFFQGAFSKLAHESGVPADVVESAFWHYNDDVCRGDMSIDDFNKTLAERLQVDEIDWRKYYLDAVDPIPEMHELVAWAASNYRVGLLTNIMPGLVEGLKAAGLIPNIAYDAIIDSSQVGAIKPERKIYEIATERTGVQPHEILLVDDDRANLRAAEHVGWRVLWFDDYRTDEFTGRLRANLEPAE